MANGIEWMYDRKQCTTCKRTRAFLESVACQVSESVESSKTRFPPEQAYALLEGITKLIATKGKKVLTFDLTAGRPDEETLKSVMIGPSGNLRAPTVKVGTTMMVGFDEAAYKELLDVA
ncbi:ArsC family (seleno)protein [Tuwongella immobilis]|uniref:Glutaredoxin domain-containing protein n=1 Tax=Tuwongella immobilis TaxID=692036 RepID=A0A6C2YSH5_9BACT|nr:ArsC family (seleno)protein [Tuwongella immobilis]VIP04297.1 Uncharacterized protein OS=Denitrovibrio acetiphilus (strain DSM 12809 / N2460) GN=Dacet_2599 PE=4 SV=1: ArsC [Tuwongella immobilis]VTS05957.1 Uncharacterized protein OS=Denitrovibrio acetiphilus (strain DSM 12809 / N2460) GN=Dacet_2599 PE=4 SV=1: ArsC [Tuwongella immobilis]